MSNSSTNNMANLGGNSMGCTAAPFAATNDPLTIACKKLPPSFIKKGLREHQLMDVAYGRDYI